MEITYKDLKKALNETIKKEYDPRGPMWHYVKKVVIGKLQLTDFLNDCGDFCDHEEAIEYYKASLILEPGQKKLFAKLALNYHLSNRNKKALKYIDKELVTENNNVECLELKQSILIDLRRFSEALFIFERIDVLNPRSSTNYFNRGKAFTEVGFYEKAIDSLLKAMELDPDNIEIPYQLAQIYRFHLLDEVLASKYFAMAEYIQ